MSDTYIMRPCLGYSRAYACMGPLNLWIFEFVIFRYNLCVLYNSLTGSRSISSGLTYRLCQQGFIQDKFEYILVIRGNESVSLADMILMWADKHLQSMSMESIIDTLLYPKKMKWIQWKNANSVLPVKWTRISTSSCKITMWSLGPIDDQWRVDISVKILRMCSSRCRGKCGSLIFDGCVPTAKLHMVKW